MGTSSSITNLSWQVANVADRAEPLQTVRLLRLQLPAPRTMIGAVHGSGLAGQLSRVSPAFFATRIQRAEFGAHASTTPAPGCTTTASCRALDRRACMHETTRDRGVIRTTRLDSSGRRYGRRSSDTQHPQGQLHRRPRPIARRPSLELSSLVHTELASCSYSSRPRRSRTIAMDGITFVTGNANKLAEVNQILGSAVRLRSQAFDRKSPFTSLQHA